ncbi:hypothetical protein J4E93_007469 [Alternaria ventricosa]|uniref:uncharacterized protein n=1 Tax=Alternaria ventricosa TaxID=1187951 RepID=UPI0020C2090B|nr:uncharacterized protein J4E93_007469 [Alternaria ventricosa]KAI4642322.1 hypothetical protein J4E93_007469 [Alternaria ventricosa]
MLNSALLSLFGLVPSVLNVALAQTFTPAPGNFPAKGDGDFAGGIFSISLSELPKYTGAGGTGPESPQGNGAKTSGSGPYPAQMLTDSTLPRHTIFAPKTPPTGNLSLPFIAWGNGGCGLNAGIYERLLVEIASYGYVIAADGTPDGSGFQAGQQSKVQDMRDSLDWAFAGKAKKYGNVDLTKVTTAGHSCGGLESMSTAYHDDRVKRIMLFNIAIFQDDRRYLLKELKVPMVYLIGGPKDMGYNTSAKDYALLNTGTPKLRANLDTGHDGTFAATNGGKQGKAAVAYLEWQWRGNATARAYLLDGGLEKDNWVEEHANWS